MVSGRPTLPLQNVTILLEVVFLFEVVFFGEMHCPKLMSESRKKS